MTDINFKSRLERIAEDVELAEGFSVRVGVDFDWPRYYYQIKLWRKDVITGEMGFGYGGKAYLSEHASDSELVQTIFGLYKSYWEHEARETFKWRGRRVFGPHISTEALWEVAKRVDVRARKVSETPIKDGDSRYVPGVSEMDDDMSDDEWLEYYGDGGN